MTFRQSCAFVVTTLVMVAFVAALPALAGDPAGGWCLKTDMNYDRQRTLTDVAEFVDAMLVGSPGASTLCAGDANLDGLLNGDDVSEFVKIFLYPDSDGDGIPDLFETNDGNFASAMATGSDPNLADTDGDALRDGDEVYDTVAGLDLHTLGCSPVRKNICIEADWFDEAQDGPFHSHKPTLAVINALKAAFTNSPVTNPYGGPTGITLIFDDGSGGALTGGNLIPGGDVVVVFDSEFNTYKAANFAVNRNGYFHYSIYAHHYNSTSNFSSGFAELPGDDFCVTLQTYLSNSNVSKTIMHELGHNLNLGHGGFEARNFKVNYNSVMNYRYQFDGVDSDASCDALGDGILNYSTGSRALLNEQNLDEFAGVCNGVAIDWNQDSVISTGVQRNINCYYGITYPCGSADLNLCGDTVCGTMMRDSDDWAGLVFTGISDADFARARQEIVTCQDTPSKGAQGK